MKAEDIVEALRVRHAINNDREWAFFDELRVGTGYRYYDYEKDEYDPFNPEQRIDAWAINLYRSNNFRRVAYEIKVSRSDFLSEIRNPDKRRQALELSNEFYFVAPKGLLKTEEMPEECGLMEVDENLKTRIVKRAPHRQTDGLVWQFLCSIARRADVAEGAIEMIKKQKYETD